jgi:uncharacterized protein DUF2845
VHANITLANLIFDMSVRAHKFTVVTLLLATAMLLPESAAAFRCGNKLVKDGMHEVEVVAICGEPTTKRHLGFAIRSVDIRARQPSVPGLTNSRSYSYPVEVMVTEYVYNLGPRKLMRRLVFEGSLLVSVETLGRGYRN